MSDTGAELRILQAVRLKGRVARRDLVDADVVLIDSGLLTDGPTVRLTADGRARLQRLLDAERATVDAAAANQVYEDFGAVNAELKPVIAGWQKTRGTPDEDAAAVLARVDELHRAVLPVIAAAGRLVPRMRTYADRLDAALRLTKAEDTSWLTRPMVDSYHTVWFELHEELIGLAGRTRAEEAGAWGAD